MGKTQGVTARHALSWNRQGTSERGRNKNNLEKEKNRIGTAVGCIKLKEAEGKPNGGDS